MKFGPVPLEEAEGKVLGHNVTGADGRRALRKGRSLTAKDVETLRRLGHDRVYVAELEAGDIDEDTAAGRVAEAVMGNGLRLSGPSTGRANLYTTVRGVVRVDVERLEQINSCQGVTIATLPANTAVGEGKAVATIKILPYALPQATVERAVEIADNGPTLTVDAFPAHRVALILSGSPAARERIERSFANALRPRLEALGATLDAVEFVPLEEADGESRLAAAIEKHAAGGAGMIILAGETAIMDRHDIAPRAVERAGGNVVCFGAPVDPGNLLMLAYHGQTPIVGAPGCARSPKDNIVDLVLPRLLVGDRLGRADVVAFGHGGLLEDVPERPSPRSRLP